VLSLHDVNSTQLLTFSYKCATQSLVPKVCNRGRCFRITRI